MCDFFSFESKGPEAFPAGLADDPDFFPVDWHPVRDEKNLFHAYTRSEEKNLILTLSPQTSLFLTLSRFSS
jgi:hypothetical protein